ncbi:MAG: GNAT family N-acetyltransferase [Planctomycetaceae bacterium]|nr:GNAT family N-acetyltransferase [Planctomycetaceae bacterium]
MESADIRSVHLRDVTLDDLPTMYEFNLDPAANRLAMTIERDAANFATHWRKVLADPSIVVKAICIGEELVGQITCFPLGDKHFVGYWLGQAFWGRGIATRALKLLLHQVTHRPLYAHAATSNEASLRVLQKCGFVVQKVELTPADARNLECEEALLILA